MNTVWIIAAILLALISMFLQQFTALRMILYALLLIVIMIFRPEGLMGSRELSLKLFKRLSSTRLRRSRTLEKEDAR